MESPGAYTALLGTTTGTLFTVAANISSGDYLKTILLAALGALSSFIVSAILKWLIRVFRRRSR